MDTPTTTVRDICCERCGSLVVTAARGVDGNSVVRAIHTHYLDAGHLPAPRRAEELAHAS